MTDRNEKELSSTQKKRIEDNRLKALALRRSRIRHNPYQGGHLSQTCSSKADAATSSLNLVEDSRGGFMLPKDGDIHGNTVQSRGVTQDDRKWVFFISGWNLFCCSMRVMESDGSRMLSFTIK